MIEKLKLKIKSAIFFFALIFSSCAQIKLYYAYTPRSFTWPRTYNLKIFVGDFKENPDSVFGEMVLIGTEHNLRNVFVIEPRDFLRRAFVSELESSNLFQVTKDKEEEADIILRGTLDRFNVNIKIHKIPQQPNGLEYQYRTEGFVKATFYLYKKDKLIYKINAKSNVNDKGEMFLFGHWEDVVREEIDKMLQPMIFAVLDSVETFLSKF